VTIGTAVAIAFARTPMTLASTAFDLALSSEGRFVLGLGSQVKGHIERRFSMPWSRPAARMREYVMALRAIWATWQTGERLDFRGEFYTHTLMTPFFSPAAHSYGPPPIYLAGVGELMTEVAGEVCDGFFFHPLTSERSLAELTLPALRRGRARAGHDGLEGFTVTGPAFTCTGRDDGELATAIKGTKAQIAFYASTPAYRAVLDLHGWGELQPELNALTRAGRWSEMGDAIDDEMLHAFAIVGAPDEVGRGLVQRWGAVAPRVTLYAPYKVDPAALVDVLESTR
jgi:probable F420-dependent oxidoreductase